MSEAIKRKYYKGVTDRGCGLAMGNKCQHKHIFGCHQSSCLMNFYRRNATQGEIPWAVLVVYLDGGACSGSILNKKWVMTETHCVLQMPNANRLKVFLGISPIFTNDRYYDVKQCKVHHLYNNYIEEGMGYDIALVQLSQPIVFGPDVCSVCLPPLMYEHGEKETALFAGYGVYDVKNRLQTGWVNFNASHIHNNPYDYTQSRNQPPPKYISLATILWSFIRPWFGYKAPPTGILYVMWRTPPDSGYFVCKGDSGGPLVQFDRDGRAVQIGICQSHDQNICDPCTRGVPKQKDIEQFNMAMIFTRVAFFTDWIQEQIAACRQFAGKKRKGL